VKKVIAILLIALCLGCYTKEEKKILESGGIIYIKGESVYEYCLHNFLYYSLYHGGLVQALGADGKPLTCE
jgi:isoprenylcysteine carboxyl methyltransferase (ICMT) family protein YpbQ